MIKSDPNKPTESAIEILQQAIKDGTLSENHKARITTLLTSDVRPELESTIKEDVTSEPKIDKDVSEGRITITTLNTLVDYQMPLEEAINAGNYAWVDENVRNGDFPYIKKIDSAQEVALQLVQFARWRMYDFLVLERFKKLGLRAANLAELLALGATYPQLQEEFPITALGSKRSVAWKLSNAPPVRHYPKLTKRDVYGKRAQTGPGQFFIPKIGIERIVDTICYDRLDTGQKLRFLAVQE